MSEALVFKPSRAGNYELCDSVHAEDSWRVTDEIDGSTRLATWIPIAVKLIHEDEGRTLQAADAPWYGVSSKLIFKTTAVRALGTLLQQYGELLPLICKEANLVMYNPTRVIDALDEQKSTITRFDDGRIMMIDKHVFHAEKIADVDVFKLPMRASATYVSQRFVDLWASHGLTGLDFVPVK